MHQLEDLLQSVSPAAAVMLNLEISLTCPAYMEQSATLSVTLLPYISKVMDFSFLVEDTHFIAGRFLAALSTHLSDMRGTLTTGFVLFALHLNPRALKELITTSESKDSLKKALLHKGFSAATTNIICLFPDKFLFPDLLKFWQT